MFGPFCLPQSGCRNVVVFAATPRVSPVHLPCVSRASGVCLACVWLDVLPAVSRFSAGLVTISAGFVTVSATKVTYGVIPVAEVVINPAFVVMNPAETRATASIARTTRPSPNRPRRDEDGCDGRVGRTVAARWGRVAEL